MNTPIIDAHAHLWLRQDTSWNGMPIKTLKNGRSFFLTEDVQMLPPFMISGENSAEVFLSNMDYAQVNAAVIVQEFIDGIQNDYLGEVKKKYNERFFVFGMCDYFKRGFFLQAKELFLKGFQGLAIPGHRLILDDSRVSLSSQEMMEMFHFMEENNMILSLCLASDGSQIGEISEVIKECPRLKIAIGHFGMVTSNSWKDQIKLALEENVMIESGGITWLFNSEFYPFKGAIKAIKEAISLVGIEKLMWGSDYPRTITAITYKMSYDFIQKSSELSEEEKSLFLGGNAKSFYNFGDLPTLPYIKNMSE